jgi:protein-S-isoprenylcysteine O-methyltransferase Ste14
MITGIYQSFMMLLGVIPFYMTDTYFHHKYDPKRKEKESGRNWWIVGGSVIVAFILFLQPVIWPQLSFVSEAWWGLAIQFCGILLMFGAAVLNYWARKHLGIFYVQGSKVQEDHQLIESGPYALVRHPLFTAYFMIVIGMVLCNPSVITFLLLVAVYFYLNMWTRKDETILTQELPGYEAYMGRTNRFVPTPSALGSWVNAQIKLSKSSENAPNSSAAD